MIANIKTQTTTAGIKVADFLNETNWTQGTYARNAWGKRVDTFDAGACQFCLLGAINRCYRDHEERRQVKAKVRQYIDGKYRSISGFNDNVTWFRVQRIIRLAGI